MIVRSSNPAFVRRTLLGAGSAAAMLAALALTGCSKSGSSSKNQLLAKDSVILCLGDSLTFGYALAAPAQSYPSQLEALTGHVTKNAGLNGDTTEGALSRLPDLLENNKPGLVLVSIGGNDFLRGVPLQRTKAALVQIVRTAQAANTPVVLVAQPRPAAIAAALGSLEDHPVYAEVSTETGASLFAGAWSKVLSNADWRSDPIHANNEGYRVFAQDLADWLRAQQWIAKA